MTSEKTETPVTEKPVDEPSPASSAQGHEPNQNNAFFKQVASFFGDWYYVWEVFGIAVSGLAIIVICMIVHYYDGKEIPNWTARVPGRKSHFRLTINSLLSIISVLGSTCAMIPVTKGLGQLKYLWFIEQDRKLADLEIFDSASRGKLGSARLIWKLRFKHLAALGGLASLLALAYGPFVQNLLITAIKYRPADDNALLSFSLTYNSELNNGTATAKSLQYLVEGALTDTSYEWAIPANKCKTGECIWGDYYTIAACSLCADISHLLTRNCTPVVTSDDGLNDTGGCNVALPNGFSFNNILPIWGERNFNPHRIIMAMNTTTVPLVYTNYTEPLVLVQTILGFPPGSSAFNSSTIFTATEDSPLSAQECVIIPCLQRQRLTLTRQLNGSNNDTVLANAADIVPLIEIVESSNNYTLPQKDGLMWINIDDLSHIRNISKQQADQFMRPRMSEITYKGLRGYLRGILGGYLWSMPNATEFGYTYEMTAIQRMYNHTIDKTWTPIHCNGSNEATKTDGVACGMNKVAAALTNAFRLADWQTQNEDSRSVIRGTTKVARQICTAQWQYVSAPLAVWILGLVLFIGVVIKTRRAKIKTWRTSPLATLLMNLDPDSREHLKDWQHMGDAELQTVAQELRLRLHMDENGPRFVRKNV